MMEWKSMGLGWHPIYEMENNPVMFETTNQHAVSDSQWVWKFFIFFAWTAHNHQNPVPASVHFDHSDGHHRCQISMFVGCNQVVIAQYIIPARLFETYAIIS